MRPHLNKSSTSQSRVVPLDRSQPGDVPAKPLWKQPLAITAAASVLMTLYVGYIWDQKTQRLLVILTDDQSQSGAALADARKEHCHKLVDGLKSGDEVVQIAYADKAEITQKQPVEGMVSVLGFCEKTPVPKAIGKNPGTAPTAALAAALGQIQSARAQGNYNPAFIALYLQAAETVPGQRPLNLDQLQAQIDTITQQNAVVSIFGPTGELQEKLNRLTTNPRVQVWPLSNAQSSVSKGYDLARQLKPQQIVIAEPRS